VADYLFFIWLVGYSLGFCGKLRNGYGGTPYLDVARGYKVFLNKQMKSKRHQALYEKMIQHE